jgi:hypothetical protein
MKMPPLQAEEVINHNFPAQLTTFIGREKEIAEMKKELESHRLVTLTGGTGRFEGASGSFTVERVLNRATGISTGTLSGTIVLP